MTAPHDVARMTPSPFGCSVPPSRNAKPAGFGSIPGFLPPVLFALFGISVAPLIPTLRGPREAPPASLRVVRGGHPPWRAPRQSWHLREVCEEILSETREVPVSPVRPDEPPDTVKICQRCGRKTGFTRELQHGKNAAVFDGPCGCEECEAGGAFVSDCCGWPGVAADRDPT